MNGVCDLLPSSNLLFVPNSRSMRPFSTGDNGVSEGLRKFTTCESIPLAGDKSAFCDNEAGASASTLSIVLHHDVIWDCRWCAIAGERRHANAIANRNGAELEGGEKCCRTHRLGG